MADAKRRSVASGGATFGAILVLVGVGILLERSGVIPEGALWRLWDLWPLLLVGWGLAVLAQSTQQAWLAWIGPVLVLAVGDTSWPPLRRTHRWWSLVPSRRPSPAMGLWRWR